MPLVKDHVGSEAMGYMKKVFGQLRDDEYTWCTNHPMVLTNLQELMNTAQERLALLQE